MDDGDLLGLLHEVADAIALTLGGVQDWGLTGGKLGEHHSDVAADAAAVRLLEHAGVGVLSEESGERHLDRPVVVVIDPLDGSTNASRRLPWYASSLCAVDRDGPVAAVVDDIPNQRRFEAVRGGGARLDGVELQHSGCTSMPDAIIALTGYPPRDLGWYQFRALGAAALDLCAVASGAVDGFADCIADAHGAWDYLGGLLVCREAGAVVTDAFDRDLVVLEHGVRRTPVAAATPALHAQLVEWRRGFPSGG